MQLPKKNWCLSLDSLSDTMTNGVGILILILVVTASAGILNPNKPDGRRPPDPCELPPDSLSKERMQIEITRMTEDLANLTSKTAQTERQVQVKQDELDELQKENKAKELRIPTLQAAPENLKPIYFVCRNNRICPLDAQRLYDRWVEGIRQAVGQKTGQITLDYDKAAKIRTYFKAHDIGDSHFRMTPTDLGYGVTMDCLPRSRTQGETVDQIRRPTSDYAKAIQAADPGERLVVFWVWSDSFEVYVAAKEIADAKGGLLGNWIPMKEDEEVMCGGGGGGLKHQ